MYYTINQQIIQARAADLHRQAQQDALARAARQGRLAAQAPVRAWRAPAPPHHRTPRAHRLGRPRLTGTGGPASGSTTCAGQRLQASSDAAGNRDRRAASTP